MACEWLECGVEVAGVWRGSGWSVAWEWLECGVGVAGVWRGSGWSVAWEWLECGLEVAWWGHVSERVEKSFVREVLNDSLFKFNLCKILAFRISEWVCNNTQRIGQCT